MAQNGQKVDTIVNTCFGGNVLLMAECFFVVLFSVCVRGFTSGFLVFYDKKLM